MLPSIFRQFNACRRAAAELTKRTPDSVQLLCYSRRRSIHVSTVTLLEVKELENMPVVTNIFNRKESISLESGDLEPLPKFDLNERCLEYDGLQEYDNAPADVQKILSLKYAGPYAIRKRVETDLVRRVQRYEDDFDSPEVAIARQTATIRFARQRYIAHREQRILTYERFNYNLMKMISITAHSRNEHLTSLRFTHYEKFAWLLEKLKLTYHQHYPKENVILQKIYHRLRINEAKAARKKRFEKYHQMLKAQHEQFFVNKERELAAFDKEEAELLRELKALEAAKPKELLEETLVDEMVEWKKSVNIPTAKKKFVGVYPPPYVPPLDKKK